MYTYVTADSYEKGVDNVYAFELNLLNLRWLINTFMQIWVRIIFRFFAVIGCYANLSCQKG